MPQPLKFLLYSRAGCELCEQMLLDIAAVPAAQGIALEIKDVDQDPRAAARYGHKVPVLLLEGDLVCHGRLDAEELHKALAYHA